MIEANVMAALDRAGIPRTDGDGRVLLQATRVALLAMERDRLRAEAPATLHDPAPTAEPLRLVVIAVLTDRTDQEITEILSPDPATVLALPTGVPA